MFKSEVHALISLDHPHVVKVIEYFEDNENFHVVSELCAGRDLLDYICETGPLPEEAASIITRQCLKALIGCHTKNFVHRDLKPENIMLVGRDSTVKLIDFGLAGYMQPNGECKDFAGTPGYMAPEVALDARHYNSAVDVWSLGCVIFAMLTATPLLPPGKEKGALKSVGYVKRRCSEELEGASADIHDLLDKMLEHDPKQRITAEEALQHPFVQANWHGSIGDSHFAYTFDRDLPGKMARYAEASYIRRTALLCLVHLAGACSLPDDLHNQLLTARHHFRSLDRDGDGHIRESEVRERLQKEGVPIPKNFGEVFRACDCSQEGTLEYVELVACIMIGAQWPDFLLRETFTLLDRSRNGVIEIEDLAKLYHLQGGSADACKHVLREADPDNLGYINYDSFLRAMGVEVCKDCHR